MHLCNAHLVNCLLYNNLLCSEISAINCKLGDTYTLFSTENTAKLVFFTEFLVQLTIFRSSLKFFLYIKFPHYCKEELSQLLFNWRRSRGKKLQKKVSSKLVSWKKVHGTERCSVNGGQLFQLQIIWSNLPGCFCPLKVDRAVACSTFFYVGLDFFFLPSPSWSSEVSTLLAGQQCKCTVFYIPSWFSSRGCVIFYFTYNGCLIKLNNVK